jgi:hypothetical protein
VDKAGCPRVGHELNVYHYDIMKHLLAFMNVHNHLRHVLYVNVDVMSCSVTSEAGYNIGRLIVIAVTLITCVYLCDRCQQVHQEHR